MKPKPEGLILGGGGKATLSVPVTLSVLALTEAGNSRLTSSVFHGLAGKLCFTPYYQAFFAYTAIAESQRMVILSAEFGGKQSHEFGPRSSEKANCLTGNRGKEDG